VHAQTLAALLPLTPIRSFVYLARCRESTSQGDGLTITEGENQDAHTERQRQNRRRRNRRKMGEKPMRTDGFITNIHSRNPFDVIRADVVLARMEKQANRGCGLYYEIYEARLLSMAMIHLAKLPLNDRPLSSVRRLNGVTW
jgi:hypothetical protein